MVLPVIIIVSDYWKSYDDLHDVYLKMNYLLIFNDPTVVVHIQMEYRYQRKHSFVIPEEDRSTFQVISF